MHGREHGWRQRRLLGRRGPAAHVELVAVEIVVVPRLNHLDCDDEHVEDAGSTVASRLHCLAERSVGALEVIPLDRSLAVAALEPVDQLRAVWCVRTVLFAPVPAQPLEFSRGGVLRRRQHQRAASVRAHQPVHEGQAAALVGRAQLEGAGGVECRVVRLQRGGLGARGEDLLLLSCRGTLVS